MTVWSTTLSLFPSCICREWKDINCSPNVRSDTILKMNSLLTTNTVCNFVKSYAIFIADLRHFVTKLHIILHLSHDYKSLFLDVHTMLFFGLHFFLSFLEKIENLFIKYVNTFLNVLSLTIKAVTCDVFCEYDKTLLLCSCFQ